MSSTSPPVRLPVDAAAINAAHQLYGQLTGQSLRLAFDRERLWYELLRAGYGLEDLRVVITYLQREIRAGRRNVVAFRAFSWNSFQISLWKPGHFIEVR